MDMKRYLRLIGLLSLAMISLTAIPSCSRFGKAKGQSTEFATFIKAYTSGIVSDDATIKVELAAEVPDAVAGEDVKDGVLTFSPALRGTSRWLTPRVIEFIPEAGALKPGQAYTARLRLDKLHKVSERRLKRFSFSFLVAIKEAVLTIDGITITAASPETASVEGRIALTEELPIDKVQSMITYEYPEKSAEVNVTAGPDSRHFHFEILNLPRGGKDKRLTVKIKPEDTGFVTDSMKETVIPATGSFRLISAERFDNADPFIDVYFSEALADMDDFAGIIELENVERYYVEAKHCHARIFFEGASDTPVRLRVDAGLKDYSGASLGSGFTKDFTPTRDKPAVEISVDGSILPNSKELMLPFKAVNLKAVDIRVIQIYEDNVLTFLQDNDLNGSNSLRRSGRLIYKRCLRLDNDPSKNLRKWQDFSVDLSGLFKQEAGAIYRVRLSFKKEYSIYGRNDDFKSGTPSNELVDIASEDITEEDNAEWDRPYPYQYDDFIDWSEYNWKEADNPMKPSYYMREERFPAVNLLSSNLGIIAKYSGKDRIWVSVSDIISTEPVFNSELYVYSYQLKEIGYAKTGTDGMAEIKLSGKPFVIVAKRSGATSYLKVTDGEEKSLSRFDVGGKTLDKGLKAFVYGERGVWRPGDTMHVTMILEDKEHAIPDSHPAVLELYTPGGQFYTKLVNAEGSDGFYAFDVKTKPEDPTGIWNAYLKVGGATFHKALRIESVKPNRLKINTTVGDGKAIDGGAEVPVAINSSWLTGPAASGLRANVTMTLSKGNGKFPGHEGFIFENPSSDFAKSEHVLLDTRLGKDGKARVTVAMPEAKNAPGMLAADILTTVEEPGGNTSFSGTSMAYSPFSSYVGVKLPTAKDHYLETGAEYPIEFVDVDKDGKTLEGAKIEYSVFKLKWNWWWESRSESLDSYVNGTNADPIISGSVTSGSKPQRIPFKVEYPEWGRYLVVARDASSGHVSGGILYVDWPASMGRSSKRDPDALTMLTFSTDKDSYEVGETVSVYIPAAGKGHALVSIETSREVVSREWVKTSPGQDATYKFKVTPEMAPNFYIHISLTQPHERADNDLPIRLYGVQPVSVSDKSSRLEPVISMPDAVRPEKEFSIKISERNKRPMTYTLAIVDEGLLDLTSFKTPDPWAEMRAREALGVRTWDSYDDVIGAYSGRFSPMFSVGGDQDLRIGARKDNRFNPVVEFLGPFTLQSGTATHKITLPMYFGSVRVMVVAARDEAYGNAEKTVPVKLPLMVLPTLPRVLGTGDKVTLPVNVFALEDGLKSATVKVSADGPVRISDRGETSVAFDKPGDKLVRFNLEATGTGMARIRVTASGGGHESSQEILVEVRNPNPATVSVSRTRISPGETTKMTYSPFETSEDEWASLELATFPSIDYGGVFSFFKDYGFDGTEQLSAKGTSLLAIRDALDEKRKEEADKMINEAVRAMYSRQLPNGGFACWPGSPDASGWVTSMVGQFLTEASRNGFPVSKGVLASWARFQKRSVQEYRGGNGYLPDLDQAYRLYTLALASDSENGAMNRLKESENLSAQANWMLASAYALSGKKNVANDIIGKIKGGFGEHPESDETFGSATRDMAIAMEALALTDEIPGAIDLAEDIAKSLSEGYYSTQEAAFATHALKRLGEKSGMGDVYVELIEGETEPKTMRSAKSAVVTELDSKTGSAKVRNLSDGSVYATIVTSSKPLSGERTAARASGLSLNVRYLAGNGTSVNPHDIPQGTEFLAEISVRNTGGVKDYRNLALTQALPSGWEVINDFLSTGADTGAWDYRDIRDDRVVWTFGLDKGAGKTFMVKLRAVYEGEFTLPAVKCEALYDPKVFAHTASGTAKVAAE